MYEKFGQFIDGKWQQSSSGETYEVINPATEEIIGKASKANSKDIQQALKSAEKGLEIWKNTSPWERSKVIRKISELMRKKVDTLSKWLTLEVGKTLMTVTSGASLVVGQYIQINSEVMRVEEKDNVSIIVARGQYRTAEMKHSNGDVINLINAADHALIEVGDDFGFNSDIDFFQDSKFFSPSQGTDQ